VNEPSGHYIALLWLQVYGLTLKVNDEVSIENKEKFVVIVMLMPVVLALHNSKPYYRIIHLA